MAEYDIGEAFRRIEDELIASMQRNLSHHINLEEEEGISYTMWQVEQLAALQRFQQENAKEFPKRFTEINKELETVLRDMHESGGFEQEEKILNAIKRGWVAPNGEETMQGTFFGKNSRKLAALINSTRNDMERAETAVLRLVNDQYRKIIYNSQVYYNTGAGTLAQCVDMASHDFLAAGINCVEYKNGARVGIDSYAEMALRTASTRAYLQGEAEMRDGWGLNTVKVMSRGNACHKCMQWVGRVYYDDVWSAVPPPPAGKRKYPLLSEAIEGGLYHPNCKDTHSTYFEGLDDEPEKPTQKDADKAADAYNAEQKKRYAQRQERKYERLATGSVDAENVAKYEAKKEEWSSTARKLFTINDGDGIINTKRVVSTKLASSGKVANPMDESDYYRIKASLNKRGIEVFAATSGDDLRYMLYIGAEGTYSNGRITHIGEIPSRGTFFEEIIHMRQSEVYGELLSTDTVELCAREIEANRKLLKYKKEYKLDSLDIKDIERNILAWEQSFQRITGVSYDESNYWRKI